MVLYFSESSQMSLLLLLWQRSLTCGALSPGAWWEGNNSQLQPKTSWNPGCGGRAHSICIYKSSVHPCYTITSSALENVCLLCSVSETSFPLLLSFSPPFLMSPTIFFQLSYSGLQITPAIPRMSLSWISLCPDTFAPQVCDVLTFMLSELSDTCAINSLAFCVVSTLCCTHQHLLISTCTFALNLEWE